MTTQRLTLVVGSLSVGAVVICLFAIAYTFRRPSTTYIDSPRLIAAIEALKHNKPELIAAAQVFSRGQTLPSAVTLRELISGGFISAKDVRAFEDMDVTIYPAVSDTDPQAILVRARMPDGVQIVAMADGSLQMLPK